MQKKPLKITGQSFQDKRGSKIPTQSQQAIKKQMSSTTISSHVVTVTRVYRNFLNNTVPGIWLNGPAQ